MFNKEHTQTNTFHTWHKQIMIQDTSRKRNCINTRESLYTIYTYLLSVYNEYPNCSTFFIVGFKGELNALKMRR